MASLELCSSLHHSLLQETAVKYLDYSVVSASKKMYSIYYIHLVVCSLHVFLQIHISKGKDNKRLAHFCDMMPLTLPMLRLHSSKAQ